MSAPELAPAAHGIPGVAWRCAIGVPVADAGRSHVTHEIIIDDGPWGGVPLGGLGSGSIGRTPRGDFARWHLDAGRHHFESIPACQFSVYTSGGGRSGAHVLSTIRPSTLESWGWDLPAGAGTYHAPVPERMVRLRLGGARGAPDPAPALAGHPRQRPREQLPGWRVRVDRREPGPRAGDRRAHVHLAEPRGALGRAGPDGRPAQRAFRGDDLAGVVLAGPDGAEDEPWSGTFAIAAEAAPGLHLSTRSRFDADDGADVWADFSADGRLDDVDDPTPSRPARRSGRRSPRPSCSRPARRAPSRSRSPGTSRSWSSGPGGAGTAGYTRFFGTTGTAAPRSRPRRSRTGRRGRPSRCVAGPGARCPRPSGLVPGRPVQRAVLPRGRGDVLGRPRGRRRERAEPGPFACSSASTTPSTTRSTSTSTRRSRSSTCGPTWPAGDPRLRGDGGRGRPGGGARVGDRGPGGPQGRRRAAPRRRRARGGPVRHAQHYHLQDVNGWKDLDPKFVLLVWQAVALLGDEALVAEAWPAVVQALRYVAAFDRDGDGLPEHDGVPDQTYDTWPMRGPSAYGGSLWLAALRGGDRDGRAGRRRGHRARGCAPPSIVRSRPSRRTLWSGARLPLRRGRRPSGDSIMADQLAGQWWADATEPRRIPPAEHVARRSRTVFEHNVLGFGDGWMGAVNGTRPDGSVDDSSEQSQEVLGRDNLGAGRVHAAVAGSTAEAWQTAEGVERVMERRGYRFRTPEAYDVDGNFRATHVPPAAGDLGDRACAARQPCVNRPWRSRILLVPAPGRPRERLAASLADAGRGVSAPRAHGASAPRWLTRRDRASPRAAPHPPTAPPTAPPSIDPDAWELAWSDEFDGPAGTPPDPATWGYDLGDGSAVGLRAGATRSASRTRTARRTRPRMARATCSSPSACRRIAGLLVRPVRAHLRAAHDQGSVRDPVRASRGADQGPRRLRPLAGLLAARHEHRDRVPGRRTARST